MSMHGVEDGFVRSRFGRLHYLAAGEGPPLVLLHSNGGSAYEYEFVLEDLAKRFRVIAWDMPGQGDSDPITGHLRVEDYADAVIDFLDGLGIAKAHVGGSSIGGAICVALGARYAGRLDGLSIIECPFRTPQEWKSNWANTEANYAPITQTAEKVGPRLRALTPEILTRWNIDRNKAGTKTALSVMWALRDYDMARDLPLVPPGQQVIYGAKGPTIAKMDAMRKALRDPAIAVMPDCGHFPMIDAPAEFVAVLSSATKTNTSTGR